MGSWNGTLALMLVVSLVMFVGSIILAWFLIVRMPTDYLNRRPSHPSGYFSGHPAIRLLVLIAKNALGTFLLVTGLVMLLTPGQGLLFIFFGLTLVGFPGKKKMIRWVLGRSSVLKAINKIREKADRPPIEMPIDESESTPTAE